MSKKTKIKHASEVTIIPTFLKLRGREKDTRNSSVYHFLLPLNKGLLNTKNYLSAERVTCSTKGFQN